MSVAFASNGREGLSALNSNQHSNAFLQGFLDHASSNPNQIACATAANSVTFAQLSKNILNFATLFSQRGIDAGHKIAMLVPAGEDFLAATFALFYLQAVPIFIDPGVGLKKLLNCIRQSEAEWVLAAPKVKILKLLSPKTFSALRATIYIDQKFKQAASTVAKHVSRSVAPQSQVMVAYTSGATGRPKGVVFTPTMAQAICDILSETFNLEPSGCDMPLLPIFSIFNLGLGRSSVLPTMNASKPLSLNEQEVLSLIERFKVDSAFGSPTLWNKISRFAVANGVTLTSVARVFMAGAPVKSEVCHLVKKILPNGEAYTPYGATEALPVTLVGATELSQTQLIAAKEGEIGTLIGKPIKQVLVLLASVDERGQVSPAAAGEIAEILVSGPHISRNYLNDDVATAQAKVNFDGLLWHRMGDLGYFDDHGNLYFCGRKAHAVLHNQRLYTTIPVERVFNQHRNVERSALVKLPAPLGYGIVVEPKLGQFPVWPWQRKKFKLELRNLALSDPLTEGINCFFFHRSFPVDGRHNAKIFRDKLSIWAAKRL